jgi:hypothetical protein
VGQLRRFAICCVHFSDFRGRLQGLTSRLLGQGFSKELLEQRVRVFYGREQGLVGRYGASEEQFVAGCFEVEDRSECRERRKEKGKNKKSKRRKRRREQKEEKDEEKKE